MMELGDGVYLTQPKWGNTQRVVEVVDNVVTINNAKFTVYFFFKVNKIIKKLEVK